MLLAIDHISKSYGDQEVLRDITFALGTDRKTGLVGANGVGKSTLLKIILGQVQADSGNVQLLPGAEVGYLPQVLAGHDNQTIEEMIDEAVGGLHAVEERLRELEVAMSADGGSLQPALDEYGRLGEVFERRGGYDLSHRTEVVFAGLDIGHLQRDRLMATLSGGEKERAGLAALLLQSPDLLIMDEPTNHLDFSALEWLEGYLVGYRGGLLVVSHDRHFLNGTVDTIIEIAEHSHEAKIYAGNYDFYADVKAQERKQWEAAYQVQQEEIWALRKFIKSKARKVAHNRPPRDNEKFAYTAKGERVQDAISRNMRSAEEKLRRLEADPIPRPPKPLAIHTDLDPQKMVSRAPLSVSGISKRYGGLEVLKDITFAVGAQSRIVLVGPNGCGKSTLLRILAGLEEPDEGEIQVGGSIRIGYLDQEQEGLPMDEPLFEAYRSGRIGDWETLKAELLGYGLFTYPELQKKVGALSTGQKRKLQLARLIAERANLLLLDEPTNHISLDVLDDFERALANFEGPVIAVSHDRHFIRTFANEIWQIKSGRLERFLGTWNEFRAEERKMVA